MKKNYFMLAAATVMFAACAETDLVNEINEAEAQYAIGFDAFANKTTRAEMTASTLTNFKVWGYKESGTYNYTVFDGVEVTKSGNEWTYTDKQYWDEKATYEFYAVAPADNNSSIDENRMITINDVASGISTASKDYVIDRNGFDADGEDKPTVAIAFNHIMTKLSFVLKAQDAVDETIEVTSLKMHGYDNGVGVFAQSSTYNVENYNKKDDGYAEWTISSSDVTTEENASVIIDKSVTVTKSSTEIVGNSYIMVPQYIDANKLFFTISYNIVRTEKDADGNDVTVKETFTDQVASVENPQVWGTDTHFIYTISVGPDPIEFSASVLEWSKENAGSETIE